LSDDILIRAQKLPTASISDVMDILGINGVMSGISRRSGTGRIAGYARTIDCIVGQFGSYEPADFSVFPLFNAAEKSTVLIFNLGGAEVSTFGGVAASTLARRDVAGAVIDGACRDIEQLKSSGLSVASRHITPRSGKGRMKVTSQGIPIQCGGVLVNDGDLIVLDDTGVVVIPGSEIQSVLAKAEALEKGDKNHLSAIGSK
jgi:regulator of RNase E activity RraA